MKLNPTSVPGALVLYLHWIIGSVHKAPAGGGMVVGGEA